MTCILCEWSMCGWPFYACPKGCHGDNSKPENLAPIFRKHYINVAAAPGIGDSVASPELP